MADTSEMLPNYILEQIFTHLDFTYAYELTLVCRSFYNFVMTSSRLWASWWHAHPWLCREHDIPSYLLEVGETEDTKKKDKGKGKIKEGDGEKDKREEREKKKEEKCIDVKDWISCCKRRYEYELEQVFIFMFFIFLR